MAWSSCAARSSAAAVARALGRRRERATAELLRPWSEQRVSFRDATHVVVDKPAGVVAEPAPGDDADGLLERLRRHGLTVGQVLLAPPPRASGATLLTLAGPSEPPRAARPLPDLVRHLTYVAAVDGCALPASGRLRLAGADRGQVLEYRARRRQGRRALVEIRARAAPTAVLATLARHGCAVVGDVGGGGPAATRLMLHVSGLFGGIEARAALPTEMESWLSGEVARPPERFEAALDDAGVERWWLSGRCQALRLSSELSGELSGLTVDRYGDFAVVAVSSERAERVVGALSECLMDRGVRGVYLKRRARVDLRRVDARSLAPVEPLVGQAAPNPLRVRQHDLALEVSLGEGASTGLFLDQRDNWQRLRRAAGGRSVLNLFCYSGAFTVFAAAGQARTTTSIDLSAKALRRLSANLEHNGLSGTRHHLFKHDVVSWLERASRRSEAFDWIVLDPPSFGTRGRKVLETGRRLGELVAGAARLLSPRGRLLCVSHQRGQSLDALSALVETACRAVDRPVRSQVWVGGWDCPTVPGVSSTKSVLLTLG